MLAWVDLETTGLDHETDVILEIGVQLTLNDLTFVGCDSAVICPDKPLIMSDFVHKMHNQGGLLSALSTGISMAEAELRMIELVQRLPAPSPMCGSSVHFDRRFLARYMPRLEAMFHYRNIDISTIKELANRWASDRFAACPPPVAQKLHRVGPDLNDTIAEAGYYRDLFFTPTSTRRTA